MLEHDRRQAGWSLGRAAWTLGVSIREYREPGVRLVRSVVTRGVAGPMRKLMVVLVLALAIPLVATESVAASTCFADGNTLERRLMRGHIDGDGVVDAVWVGARRVGGTCRYYVFAHASTTGTSRVRVPTPDRFSRFSLRNFARPIAMVRVDSIAGKEIAVELLEGASVRAFGFFTMRLGSLRRMNIEATAPQPLAADNMFAFGGGLSLMFGTDCAYNEAPRTVVFSRAFPSNNGPRYVVERRWYQVRGYFFARTAHPTQRELVGLPRLRRRFREFRNDGLLPHCQGKVLDPRRA
jgi:hypothetical protein